MLQFFATPSQGAKTEFASSATSNPCTNKLLIVCPAHDVVCFCVGSAFLYLMMGIACKYASDVILVKVCLWG